MRIEACRAAGLFADLHAASFDEAWEEAAFGALLASPGVFAFLASEGSESAGFILFRVAADEAEVLTLSVSPEQRRKGVGRALVEAAAQAASDAGAIALLLEVAEDNGPAIELYERQGFRRTGRRKGYYDRGSVRVDALTLRRDLNTPSDGHYA